MRKVLVTTLLVAATVGSQAQVKNQSHGYLIDPVPFTSVKVTDSFWGQRLNAWHSASARKPEDIRTSSTQPTPVIPLK